ncbi:thermonuclease, partial [Staphylococcus pseudintermedius]
CLTDVIGESYLGKLVIYGNPMIIKKDGQDNRVCLIGVNIPKTCEPNTPAQPDGKSASNFTKKH